VVDAVLIRSLPYPEAARLVTLYYTYQARQCEQRRRLSPIIMTDATDSLPELDRGNQHRPRPSWRLGSTAIENLGRVPPEFFGHLGVEPLMGRAFADADKIFQSP